jgi:cell wall-associated NlpC family hydrolase
MPYGNAWNGWEGQFLKLIGAPTTKSNILFLQAWHAGEGSNATYNPLNTTRTGYAGSTNFNSANVKNYISAQQGLQANADALTKTGYYQDIVDALRAGNVTPARLAALVIASPWGTKHFPSLKDVQAAQDVPTAQSSDATQAQQATTAVQDNASLHPHYDKMKAADQIYQAIINPTIINPFAASAGSLDLLERAGPTTAMFLSKASQRSQAISQVGEKMTGFPTLPDRNPLSPSYSGQAVADVPTVTDPGGSLKHPTTVASGVINNILKIAGSEIGKPYVYGSEGPSSFDCSGLIDYAYRRAGVKLPVDRLTTYNALKLGISVKGKQLNPGDMVIVNHGEHMVMYVGGGKVIAAPHTGTVVQYQPLSRFAGSIVDVRRLIAARTKKRH